MNSPILKRLVLALSVVFLISCDSDYSEIGADIIDDDIHHNGIVKALIDVTAFDKPTTAVQANNMPVNSIGVYESPAFGKTISHFVSQLSLTVGSENPTFEEGIVLDTVYLYVPYISRLTSTDENGEGTYVVDSVYRSDENAKIKLSVFENGYYLRDSDPAASDGIQKYYTDEKSLVENFLVGSRLNDGPVSENDEFVFSNQEIDRKRTFENGVTTKLIERMAPGIYMELNRAFFETKIIDAAAAGKLINNSVFQDYFRGIYFKAEQVSGYNMAMPDFKKGKIVLRYHVGSGPITSETEFKSYTLNLTGNTVNFFDNTYNNNYLTGINASDETIGDEKLYVKGGEGSVAYVNFNLEDLDFLKENGTESRALINEANLVFYIDEAAAGNTTRHPLRLYLYDVANRRPVYDYYTDGTTNNSDTRYNKYVYSGILTNNGTDKFYKVRITDHINNLVSKDSTHITFGLSASENISQISNASVRTPFEISGPLDPEGNPQVNTIKSVPVSSVISPFGTVLHGSSPAVPEAKRVKLEIYYTKPN